MSSLQKCGRELDLRIAGSQTVLAIKHDDNNLISPVTEFWVCLIKAEEALADMARCKHMCSSFLAQGTYPNHLCPCLAVRAEVVPEGLKQAGRGGTKQKPLYLSSPSHISFPMPPAPLAPGSKGDLHFN